MPYPHKPGVYQGEATTDYRGRSLTIKKRDALAEIQNGGERCYFVLHLKQIVRAQSPDAIYRVLGKCKLRVVERPWKVPIDLKALTE